MICWGRKKVWNVLPEKMDFPAEISQENGLYRVTVGAFPTLDEAVETEHRLRQAGYQTLVVSQ